MLNDGMDTVDIQYISTSPQCIQPTDYQASLPKCLSFSKENEHGNKEDCETLGDRIKRIFKSILCWNKPELKTNLKVEVSKQDHFQIRVEKGNHGNNINDDAAARLRDDEPNLTVNCDLIGQLTETATDDGKYSSHKQLTAERLKKVENLEHPGDLLSELPPTDIQFTYDKFHAHIQSTSELLKELKNLQHHDYLTTVLPANVDSIASTQLPFTVEDIANASYHNQRPVLSSEYAECQNSINLHVIDVVNHTPDMNRVGWESNKQRSSTQSDDSTASPMTALIKSQSELHSTVTKVHSVSNETCVQNEIPLKRSTFVFKRNTKATQEVNFFLFGSNCDQLYTPSAAQTKFQNYDKSTQDFKIMKFSRRYFDDIIDVFETQEPYEGKLNDLLQILKQLESETSQQIHFNIPLQPSEVDAKLGSSSSLPVNKWSDKLNSQFAKRSERADLTSFAEYRTKTVGNTSIDQTNTAMLEEATPISQIPPKTESSENKLSTKELILDSDIRKSISKSRKVLPTHRTTEPMLTSRRKMVDAKVKKTSKYKTPKFSIFTTLDDDKTGISTVLKDDIVRQAMYDWFNNESKIQFQRPSIPWPSMHPLLPYKLRYLDEGLVDTPIVKTNSSPNDSTDENE